MAFLLTPSALLAATYTITYNANGATSGTVPESQMKTDSAALILAYNSGKLARPGYDFAGWSTTPTSSGTNYVTGATFKENRDLTLYARWMIPTMIVKQDTATASKGPSAATPHFNVRFALPIPAENDLQVNGPLVGVDPAVKSHHHSPGFEVMPNGDVLSFAGHMPGSREYTLGGPRELHKVLAKLRHGADEWEMPTEVESDIGMLMWRDGSTVWGFSGWGRSDHLGYDLPYRFRVHKSTDSGASWQSVAYAPTFTSNDADAQPIVDAFRAPNGDMFVAVDSKDGAPTSQLFRSPDNGLTWHDQGGRTSGRHSTIAITNPSTGRLLSLGGKDSAFPNTRYMPQNISTDWGVTWGAPTQSPFPWLRANQRPSMLRLRSGNLVMVGDSRDIHNPTTSPPGWSHGDGPYVALSTNNGTSWTIKALPVALKHETRAHKTLGYSTVRQAPNGLIHVFATMTHPCLHYEFNEAWITDSSAGDITPQTTGGTVQSYSENYPEGGLRATWSARTTPNGRYLLDGLETLYYPNGQKQREVTWASGRRTGVETYWGSDGIRIYSWNHDPANNVSVWTHWWRNGQKRLESQWKTNPAARDLPSRNFRGMVAHGTARHWNESGQQTAVYTFLDGNRISPRGNRTESFATTPSGWAGSGNTAGGYSFGYSSSTSFCVNQNAAYNKGEVGGTFARSTTYRYYADTGIGAKSRTNTLHLSGNLQLTKPDPKLPIHYPGVIRIGYFNTSTPGSNFVGIEIREPSGTATDSTVYKSGEQYRAYLAVRGSGGTVSSVPIELEMNFLGAAFDLIWKGNPDGSGTLSGTVTSLPINISVAAGTGSFNAFGILAGGDSSNDSTQANGSYYFDNLTYDKGTVATYTVTYNANGATGGSAPATQTKTQGVGLPLATQGDLVRSGFTFAGWNTAANGSGTNYAPGSLYTGNANLTLYAKWTGATTYTVSYNANGATSGTAPANQTKTQDVALTLETNSGNLTRTGFTFSGWNTAADGSGTNYAAGASYTTNANLALFARWTTASSETVVTETFDTFSTSSTNGWTGSGNTANNNNYGWNSTDVVLGSGTGGAAGGIFTRSISLSHFADTTIASLNRTNSMRLAGSFRLANTNYDGNFYLGYFTPGAGLGNFIGIEISEPSGSAGDPFRGLVRVSGAGGAASSVISLPQNTTLGFDLTWTGNPDGSGTLSGTLAGQSVSVTVAPGTSSFGAFGLLSGGLSSNSTQKTAGCYFDSLTYNKGGSLPTSDTYTVSYAPNGATSGTAPASQTKTQDVALTLADNSGNLARTGYSFAGWNTAADGTGTNYAAGASYTGNANLSLFAKWTANTYTVTYNANDATTGSAPANQTKTQDVALTLATNSGNLARTGYSFAGWNTAADGTGTNYAVGASYTGNANLSLFAKWTANTYTVTYNANDATTGSAPANQTKTQDVALTLATNSGNLARTGFTFAGWNTSADGTGTNYAIGASYTGNANLSLFAKWTALATYSVTYDANGATTGSAPANQTKTQDVALTLATNSGDLALTGFTFAGWNTTAVGSGTDYAAGGSYTGNANLALFAKWTPESSGTLFWDNNGGTANDWGGTANWSTVVGGGSTPATLPAASDVVAFSATPVAGTAQTVNLNGNRSVLGLAVTPDVTANTTLLGGGTNRTLTIGSSGIRNAGSANLSIGTGTTTGGQQVAVTFAGSQAIAANGGGSITVSNNVSGTGTPTITNNGTGTGLVNLGALQSTVGKVVQDSPSSKLLLRAASTGFAGTVDILQGTVMIGTHANNLGSSSGQLNLGSSAVGATAPAELEINDNGNITYVAKPIVLGTSSGTLKIAHRDDNGGPYTHTITGGVTGSNNLTIESRMGDGATDNNDKLTFTTGALNNAGTITHIGESGGDLTINAVIGSNVTDVIQDSATSRLVLGGINTYGGDTIVKAGTLAVNGTAIPDTGKLVIHEGGKVAPSGATEAVGSLFFSSVQQAAGTWGATGSGATNINDTYFTGTGVVSVNSGPVETYTVSYDANSATGGSAPASQTKTQNVDLMLASNSGSLVRTGFTFAGWNTAADGTGLDYADEGIYTGNEDLSLFARWTPVPSSGEEVTETFDTADTAAANGWTGSGNTANGNSFGWNSTDVVLGSGTGGAAGGIFTRTVSFSHLADTTIGTLGRTDTMRLAGSFRLANANFDGQFYLGYFTPGAGIDNFIGIQISEPSSAAGNPFRGFVRVIGTGGAGTSVISLPQNTTLGFDLTWTGSADGSGVLSGTFAGQSVNIPVAAGTGNFTAFGLLSGGAGTNDPNKKTAGSFFDSLTYTSATEDAPFEQWAGGPGMGFNEDMSGDGVSNGMAFLLGASGPEEHAHHLLPAPAKTHEGLMLSFMMRDAASRGSATMSVEYSSDLVNWTTVPVPEASHTTQDGVAFDIAGSGMHDVKVTIPSSHAVAGRLYARLMASE
jgi:uncharacterized repeat protein (TIGR02543 family)